MIDVAGDRDQFNHVTIDASDRIVTAGSARVPAGARSDFAVARFLPDGALDGSFNPAGPIPGIVITEVVAGNNPNAAISMAIDTAGRIVAGDSPTPQVSLISGWCATTPTVRSTPRAAPAAR